LNNLLKPTENCYRLAAARRAAFLIDGEAYFRALADSFQQAKHSIFIVGWDLHSELQLIRDETEDNSSLRLGTLLNRLIGERKQLHVYVLDWDFSMIYALEREFFPRYKFKWRSHKRIHFHLDGHHPVGASQHQKFVVVDDALAFVGGLDLSKWRWDTSAHRPDDEHRIDPDGEPYPPFHDIQFVMDGQAAQSMGKLARERWLAAGGETPVEPETSQRHDRWPASVVPDMERIQVAIARTLPAYGDREAVREVEQLYLDSIAAARHWIYIENQYLSSHRIGQALRARLEESDGPEVVAVLPQKTGGWLEQHTMDVLRGRLLRELREADREGRLRIYYPRISETPRCNLMVHAKVMVIDDDFVRVGSSNLSNRSMGLDSECDVAIVADSQNGLRSTIGRFRNRLLAEHLNADIDQVAEAIERTGSLIDAIEAIGGGERTLVALSGDILPEVDEWVPESELLDPEKPIDPDELINHFVRPDQQPLVYRHLLKVIVLIAGVLVIAAFWRLAPVSEWVDVASVKAAAEWVRQQPLTPVLVMVGYILGGLVAFPVTLMIIATVLVFGPWWGLFYALTGAELSALTVFWTGRWLGRKTVRRFAGSLLNRLSQRLSQAGLMTVITFRIVPVAPFSVINLIAGVSEIQWRDFALGTLVGMVPGVLAIVVLADRVSASLHKPDLGSFSLLAIVVLAIGAGLMALRRWIKNRRSRRSPRNAN
jgi:phospholipase D1/2